jgi:hypothetical protein
MTPNFRGPTSRPSSSILGPNTSGNTIALPLLIEPLNGKQHRRYQARLSHNRNMRLPIYRHGLFRSEVQSTIERRSHRQGFQRDLCRTYGSPQIFISGITT